MDHGMLCSPWSVGGFYSPLLTPRSSLEHAFFLKPLFSTYKQTDYITYLVGIPQNCNEYFLSLNSFAG